MTQTTPEQKMSFANEIYERSKKDDAIIVGSEIRQLYSYFIDAVHEGEQWKSRWEEVCDRS